MRITILFALLSVGSVFANPDRIDLSNYPSKWTSAETLVDAPAPLNVTNPSTVAPPPDVIYTETLNGRTFSVHSGAQVASIQISSTEMAKWNSGSTGFNNQTDRNTLSTALYDFVKDDFDFIFFINNNSSKPASFNYYGQLIAVSRDVTGISQWGTFDYTNSAGSNGKLQSYIHLPYLKAIQEGPTLHELAHNWANFFKNFEMASPSGNYAALPHWGWTGIPGQLGGFDPATLQDLGGGNWKATNGRSSSTNFDGTANGGNGLPYANWELYLMGLMPVDSLDDITYFTNVVTDATRYGNGEFSGTKNTYTVAQFLNDRGPRVPAYGVSQTDFKCLFVVLTDSPLSTQQWSDASSQVAWFVNPASDASSLYNFYEATRGVGTLDADLSTSLLNGSISTSSSSVASSSSMISSSAVISSSSLASSSSVILSSSAQLSSSSVVISSSSQSSADPCDGIPLWQSKSYDWVGVKEYVQYNGKLYSHTNWVNSTTPDTNVDWTYEGDCAVAISSSVISSSSVASSSSVVSSSSVASSSSVVSSSSIAVSSSAASSSSDVTVTLNPTLINTQSMTISQNQNEWVFEVNQTMTLDFYDIIGTKRTYQLQPGTHVWPKGNRTFFVRYQDVNGWNTTKIYGQ